MSDSVAVVPAPMLQEEASGTRKSASWWTKFRRHRLALTGMVLLAILTISSVIWPLFLEYSPTEIDLMAIRSAPDTVHLLGTDSAGRDVLSRLLSAGRVSLAVGIVAVAIYVVIGVVFGCIAGYMGGWIDGLIMRLADMVLSFPSIIVIITLVSILGPSIFNVMLVIGLLGWPPITRLVRGEFLTLRERDFVIASRSTGAPGYRIIFRHILPNALTPVIVNATFGMAQAILLEAALSFLGLGVQPPTASWGNMLNEAQSITTLEGMPWLWLPPGLLIVTAVLSINFVGDGLRDALDPRTRR